MYIKDKMSQDDFKELALLMRSLMFKWKNKDKNTVVKEISMPDMIDILCRYKYINGDFNFISNKYWEQIKEEIDLSVNHQIYLAIRNNTRAVNELYGCEGFTSDELQWIINNYIKDIPVIYIKEE